MPIYDASSGAIVHIFYAKQLFFRVTSLFGSKNRNQQPQPPGGRGTFNRKVLGPQKHTGDLQIPNMKFGKIYPDSTSFLATFSARLPRWF